MVLYLLENYSSTQVTEDGLREKLAKGTISDQALAWAPGSDGWRPVAELDATVPILPAAGNTPKRNSFQLWPAVILTAMIIWAAANATGSFALWDYLPESISGSAGLLLHIGALAIGAILTVVGAIYFWRRPTRRAGMPLAGTLFLIALATAFFALGSFIATATYAPDLYATLAAQDEVENATVFRGSDGTVYIMGSIGPHLVQDFLKAETEGPVSKVEITSGGGLVQTSLELASYIESKHLPVIVRAYCYSACIHIAVASPESYADQGAIFGFHRYAPLVPPEGDSTDNNDAPTNDEATLFLKAHGVPDAVLAIAHKHAGESIYEVTADEMVNYGAIRGTVSGPTVIRTGSKH